MNKYPISKLGDVTTLITDGKHGDSRDQPKSGFFFLSSKDLRDGRLQYDQPREINHDDFLETHRRTNLRPGDILLANCGASIGRVGIAQKDERICRTTFQKSISVIKSNKKLVRNEYLYFFCLANSKHFVDLGGGTAQPNLLIGDLKRISIPLPPLLVQDKIAGILASYDRLIENNKRRKAILEKIAEEIYREWFVRLRFPGHWTAPKVHRLPYGWRQSKVGELIPEKGLQTGKRPRGGAQDSGVPSIGAENVTRIAQHDYQKEKYVSEQFFESMRQGRIADRDILFYKDGAEIGRVTIVQDGFPHEKCSVNEHVFLVRTDRLSAQYFLYFYLSQPTIQQYIKTINKNAAQPGINKSEFRSIPILLPPRELIEQFESVLSPVIRQIFKLAKTERTLVKARNLLLPRLISGKLSVEDLDIKFPSDMTEELNAQSLTIEHA